MIVDSSVVIAVVRREPETPAIVRALITSADSHMSAPVWLETCMVLGSPRLGKSPEFMAEFAREFDIRPIDFTPAHAELARLAWAEYGKGNHPARLNFGDCVSYATAKFEDEPLLYVGGDFALTGIGSAI